MQQDTNMDVLKGMRPKKIRLISSSVRSIKSQGGHYALK